MFIGSLKIFVSSLYWDHLLFACLRCADEGIFGQSFLSYHGLHKSVYQLTINYTLVQWKYCDEKDELNHFNFIHSCISKPWLFALVPAIYCQWLSWVKLFHFLQSTVSWLVKVNKILFWLLGEDKVNVKTFGAYLRCINIFSRHHAQRLEWYFRLRKLKPQWSLNAQYYILYMWYV